MHALTPNLFCCRSSYHLWLLGIPVEHDRSPELVKFYTLPIPPTLSSDVHDREMDSGRVFGTAQLKRNKSYKSKIRKVENVNIGMFEALEKSQNTSLYIGRRTVGLGAKNQEGENSVDVMKGKRHCT